MNNKKGSVKLGTVVTTILLLIILIITFNFYRENYFNGFEKATTKPQITKFARDNKIKYSDMNSYKIENIEYNDSTFYKEIDVEPFTMYKISCMVKTENVQCELKDSEGGALIGILNTTEYSAPIEGTNDWQPIEFMFNSKNREKVKISFRLGGNNNNCSGTAWFSDFKLEKGTKNTDTEWNIGCFIMKELDVNIDGRQYNFKTNLEDIENVRLNMERYKEDCYEFSEGKMTVNYEITKIDTPVTEISYSDEHGYYISHEDVKDLIYDKVQEKEYDHVFVVCRMEDDEGNLAIPIYENWIGLGSMDMYGIGYSLIRINKNSNSYTYKYGITNQTPEEVYLHEFLHTLERNSVENGDNIPALHDYEKYGYSEESVQGLNKWYEDYMSKSILDSSTGNYIGLDDFVYSTQPPNSENFRYPIEIEFNVEPKNILEEILSIFDTLKQKLK